MQDCDHFIATEVDIVMDCPSLKKSPSLAAPRDDTLQLPTICKGLCHVGFREPREREGPACQILQARQDTGGYFSQEYEILSRVPVVTPNVPNTPQFANVYAS